MLPKKKHLSSTLSNLNLSAGLLPITPEKKKALRHSFTSTKSETKVNRGDLFPLKKREGVVEK